MKCLILGGAGFIGSHIADALVARGDTVRVFDRPNINLVNLSTCLQCIEMMTGDFCNLRDIDRALAGMDAVINLVCTTLPSQSNENPAYDVESNVIGNIHFLEASLRHGIQKVVYASSGGMIYGHPQTIPISEQHATAPLCSYGITKLMVEKYLALFRQLQGLDYTVLRIGNPYGERQRIDGNQGVIAVYLGKLLKHEPLQVWGDGRIAKDFLYIGDLVDAFLRALDISTKEKIFNISSGSPTRIRALIDVMAQVTGIQPVVNYTQQRQVDLPVTQLDVSLAASALGWVPKMSLESGIRRTWDWVRQLNI
ncbi:MAG: NAD-dependent epimerase [Deltaproteobacteria bacterium]|nr:MAG: NAD-dependent epimerase [Deltaproteobacteria bacterium]